MKNEVNNNLSVSSGNSSMSDREFSLFSSMIYTVTGIKLPPVKKLMLISRLNKRMKALEIKTFGEYYDFVCSPAGKSGEYHRMIDAVTTNKTEFFREPEHFSILRDRVLPELSSTDKFRQGNPIQIWSAGCSTGEEPYTIAMVTSEYFMGERAFVSILATDISTKVLSTAINGVYPEKTIEPIPLSLKKKYILRGKGENKGVFRVTPEIRRMINFSKLNLMDERFIFNREMDIVFCRNVIIYFDRDTQIRLFDKFYDIISPEGYLFIGSSETLHGLNDRFKPVGPTVYVKR